MPPETRKMSRRDALFGIAVLSAVAAAATISGSKVFGSTTTKENSTFVNVKVVYFGMSFQMTGVKEEYFKLKAQARLQDLLLQIQKRHEVFAAMLPTMQILLDGNPFTPQDNPELREKSEIDFIPVYAGG